MAETWSLDVLLSDLAEEYILYNVYNLETARAIRTAAKLFDQRSQITDLNSIDLTHIHSFKSETLKVANAFTYNGYLAYIKIVARYAADQYQINVQPILKISRAPTPTPKPKIIENNDYRRVVNALRSDPDLVPCTWFWILVIRFLYGVGVRRRQLVEIRVKDIDFERGMIRLRHQGSKTGREWDVPMLNTVANDLRFLKEAVSLALKRDLSPEDCLFNICHFNPKCSPDPNDSTKMRARYVTDMMKNITARTGIRIGAHRLRHTTATHLCNPADPNVPPDIFFAQTFLGHSDIRTTKGYVHADISHRRGHMEKYLPIANIGEIPLSRDPASVILEKWRHKAPTTTQRKIR